MSISRSLAKSRRHLSHKQQNWFSMQPDELKLDGLTDPNAADAASRENSLAPQEMELPADF